RTGLDVGALNGLIVSRAAAPATVKAPVANRALAVAPAAGSLVAIPAAGSPASRSAPFLAYAWTGGAATLDGAALPQHANVIEGALSNVRYTLTVTDMLTGAIRAYVNPQRNLASVADTSAFLGTGDAPPVPPVAAPPPPPGPCAVTPADLCLGSRFRVDVSWRTSAGSGAGTAVPLTGDTG